MAAKYRVFFGTYSKGEGNGVFIGEFDPANGEISLNGTIDIENPSYLQLSGNILYGVSEVDKFEDKNGGALFSIDTVWTNLTDMKRTHGKHPCHLWLKDDFIFVSNYSEGSLSIFKTDGAGNIAQSWQSIHHFGSSVNKGRQQASHVHFAAMSPDSKYLAVCDLGTDKVMLYPYSPENGLSTAAQIIDCPPGAGPRHLTFSKCGGYLYILTELSNKILVYKYNGFEFLQEISTLPGDFTDRTTSAAIHASPDGALVASSNRGHDSIAIFKTKHNGELDFLTHVMTGKEPRDFRFSPDGSWLLTANQNDSSVSVYRIEDNNFVKTRSIDIPKPVCILFGGEA